MTIVETLDSLGIEYCAEGDPGGRPGWVQVDCPYCGSQSSKGYVRKFLGISLLTGGCSCWRCGRHNTAQAISLLTARTAGDVRKLLDRAPTQRRAEKPRGTFRRPAGIGDLTAGHAMYLRRRGFDPAEIQRLWGVRGLGQAAKLAWRLYIPITHQGEEVSWTARSVRPNERMRYISAAAKDEAVPHKEVLYGADYTFKACIIHEGPIDVWATGPGAVGLFGLEYTDAQLRALSRYALRVVCFDSSLLAQRRARRLADALSAFPGETMTVELDTGDDAAEADEAELEELRELIA